VGVARARGGVQAAVRALSKRCVRGVARLFDIHSKCIEIAFRLGNRFTKATRLDSRNVVLRSNLFHRPNGQ
jgi:hypothetical protein